MKKTKSTKKRSVARKTPAKKPKKTAGKGTAKKPPSRKTAAKTTAAKKPASRKTAAKRTSAKKSASRKTAAKRTGAKNPPSKKPAARKTPAKKAATRKASTRQTAVKKTSAKRPSARKTAATSKPATQRLDGGSSGAAPAKTSRRPKKRHARSELSRVRRMLLRKREEISRHIESGLSELERPEKKHRADLEEIASDTHETDSLCEIMGIESIQIDQIEKALQQIEDGSYGICEDCGGEIPLARLEALPFATQCVNCKRKTEEIAPHVSVFPPG